LGASDKPLDDRSFDPLFFKDFPVFDGFLMELSVFLETFLCTAVAIEFIDIFVQSIDLHRASTFGWFELFRFLRPFLFSVKMHSGCGKVDNCSSVDPLSHSPNTAKKILTSIPI
jgi:hypothetical protein